MGIKTIVPMKSHLSSELSETYCDRHAVLEQDVVEGAGTEGFEIHLLFIVPELI